MKLEKIKIKNYRSIKDLTFEVKEIGGNYLRTLLGLNESGKSNILKSISELNNEEEMDYEKDCLKDARGRNEPIEISAIYSMNEEEREEVARMINYEIDSGEIKVEKRITLNSSLEKNIKWFIPKGGIKIPPRFSKVLSNFLEERTKIPNVSKDDDERDNLDAIPNKEDIELPEDDFLYEREPKIDYWKASPEYLIKNPINLEEFKNNKESNVPLRNLFKLIGLSEEDMDFSIERIKGNHAERYRISKKMSEKATKFINEVWPEHEIEFQVSIERDSNCYVLIKDKDNEEFFEMDERSDGFKQFVSILLTLSAESRDGTNKNNIILIDEPEIRLHPSGVQYIRDELMKIAKENLLIIASHSIFIIDKQNLERHVKIYKEKGETKMEEISKTNPFSEDMIYRALGTSIYEIIEPYILIFEGNTDKKLYDAFANKFKDEQDVSNLKTISATGVNEVRKYLKFFNQKTVTGIVLLDSDKEGRNVLKAIKENEKEFQKSSFEICDLIKSDKEEITLEDLLPLETIKRTFFKVYGKKFINLDGKKSFVQQIKEFEDRENLKKESKLTKFKNKLVEEILFDLSKREINTIKEKYHLYVKFFKNLNKKINDIQSLPR